MHITFTLLWIHDTISRFQWAICEVYRLTNLQLEKIWKTWILSDHSNKKILIFCHAPTPHQYGNLSLQSEIQEFSGARSRLPNSHCPECDHTLAAPKYLNSNFLGPPKAPLNSITTRRLHHLLTPFPSRSARGRFLSYEYQDRIIQ